MLELKIARHCGLNDTMGQWLLILVLNNYGLYNGELNNYGLYSGHLSYSVNKHGLQVEIISA